MTLTDRQRSVLDALERLHSRERPTDPLGQYTAKQIAEEAKLPTAAHVIPALTRFRTLGWVHGDLHPYKGRQVYQLTDKAHLPSLHREQDGSASYSRAICSCRAEQASPTQGTLGQAEANAWYRDHLHANQLGAAAAAAFRAQGQQR